MFAMRVEYNASDGRLDISQRLPCSYTWSRTAFVVEWKRSKRTERPRSLEVELEMFIQLVRMSGGGQAQLLTAAPTNGRIGMRMAESVGIAGQDGGTDTCGHQLR